MVSACMVKSWLKTAGATMAWSGQNSWTRMMSASTPPMRKKRNAVTP